VNVKYEPKTGDIDVEFDFVKASDAGDYKCKAVNIYGEDNTQALIGILRSPNIDERPQTIKPDALRKASMPFLSINESKQAEMGKPPKFIIHFPAEIKLHEGVKFKTRCNVEGYPLPKVNIFLFFLL